MMDTANMRARLRRVSVISKRIAQTTLAGDYLSAFRGGGMEFDQIRTYVPGDDVRLIDWYSSLKTGTTMVKQFVEERDRTVILVLDCSRSMAFTSGSARKFDLMTEIAAALAFIACNNKDRVGALLFSEQILHWLPPGRGMHYAHRILKTVLSEEPFGKTNSMEAFRFLLRMKQRNAIVFFLSDGIDNLEPLAPLMNVVRKKYDFVWMRLSDLRECSLPRLGILHVEDSESGQIVTLDTGVREHKLAHALDMRRRKQQELCQRRKIDVIDFVVGMPYVPTLLNFFHQRIRRSI